MNGIHVAVIGAGITGLTIGQHLQANGVSCVLFDKSRGVGGRVATRRATVEDTTLYFDHGTPALNHAQLDQLSQLLNLASATDEPKSLIDTLGLTPWQANWASSPLWTGPLGINGVGKALAASLTVQTGTTISAAHHDQPNQSWQLEDANQQDLGSFDLLITTTPPLQAAAILGQQAQNHAQDHIQELVEQLTNIRPLGCWTIMMAARQPIDALTDVETANDVVDRVIQEHTKDRASPGDWYTYTIQASRSWSQQHIDGDPELIAKNVMQALQIPEADLDQVAHQQVHRWLYAGVANPAQQACLVAPTSRLICAGDWCLGNDVDSAIASGTAAAVQALALLP